MKMVDVEEYCKRPRNQEEINRSVEHLRWLAKEVERINKEYPLPDDVMDVVEGRVSAKSEAVMR